MNEAKKKAIEFSYKFSTLEDAIKCVEEIIKIFSIAPVGAIEVFERREEFWQKVLKYLKGDLK